MKQVRYAILNDSLLDFRREFYEKYYNGKLPDGVRI